MEESDFVDGLTFEDLRKRYRSERDETLRDTLSSFEGEEEGQRRDIEAGIEDDRRHREVLNLALNLFANAASRPYKLGYRFVHGSPLLELGVPNFDVLVANVEAEEPIVILGEAKGSVSGPARVVAQTRERQQVALDPSTTSKNDT